MKIRKVAATVLAASLSFPAAAGDVVVIKGERIRKAPPRVDLISRDGGGFSHGGGGGDGGGAGATTVAALNPAAIPDARCSKLASNPTKAVMSTADATARYLAAQQLFSAIAAQNGGRDLKAAVANSPRAMYNGRLTPTFTMTYADGGSERWIVGTLVPMTLIVEGNIPDSLKTGSGQPEPCPKLA